ncbi:MAG: hypothetical protein FRX49_02748 [Trebouxia sp. A1-2]|nr:MAG: hypothetical protein FRX49_02748 [Trebouxia sp. A1-2]
MFAGRQANAEHTRRANLLQCKKEHGFAKDGPPAAPEATGIICSLLVLKLPAGCLKRHASVEDDVVLMGLEAIVWVHPQGRSADLTSPMSLGWSFVMAVSSSATVSALEAPNPMPISDHCCRTDGAAVRKGGDNVFDVIGTAALQHLCQGDTRGQQGAALDDAVIHPPQRFTAQWAVKVAL